MPTLIEHAMISGDTATPLLATAIDSQGVEIDLTGMLVRYVAYYSEASDAAAALEKSTADGTVLVSGSAITVPFLHADTSELANRTLPHEIEVTDLAGQIETIGVGSLGLRRDFAA